MRGEEGCAPDMRCKAYFGQWVHAFAYQQVMEVIGGGEREPADHVVHVDRVAARDAEKAG